MLSFGHTTVAVALPCAGLPLLADAVAVFVYTAQPDTGVPLVTCTEADAPGAMSPNAQLNVCAPAAPVMEHVPGPPYAGLMLQPTPPPGSASASGALAAVPVPAALLFFTCTVKPIADPAATVAASAVWLTLEAGFTTVKFAVTDLAALMVTGCGLVVPLTSPLQLPNW